MKCRKYSHALENLSKLLLALLLLAYGAGCASSGNNFNEKRVADIKQGVTTEPELIQWFGDPTERSMVSGPVSASAGAMSGAPGVPVAPAPSPSGPADSSMRMVLSWTYVEARVNGKSFIPVVGGLMGGHDTSHKSLRVVLKDNVVENFSASTGGMETRHTTQSTPQ